MFDMFERSVVGSKNYWSVSDLTAGRSILAENAIIRSLAHFLRKTLGEPPKICRKSFLRHPRYGSDGSYFIT